MSKKPKKLNLDEFHYHEALDRTLLFSEIIHNHLTTNLVIHEHPKLKERLEEVEDLLGEVYQMIGTYRFELFPFQSNDMENQ